MTTCWKDKEKLKSIPSLWFVSKEGFSHLFLGFRRLKFSSMSYCLIICKGSFLAFKYNYIFQGICLWRNWFHKSLTQRYILLADANLYIKLRKKEMARQFKTYETPHPLSLASKLCWTSYWDYATQQPFILVNVALKGTVCFVKMPKVLPYHYCFLNCPKG